MHSNPIQKNKIRITIFLYNDLQLLTCPIQRPQFFGELEVPTIERHNTHTLSKGEQRCWTFHELFTPLDFDPLISTPI